MISLGLTHVSGSNLALALMVTVIGFVLCVQAAVPLLSFIPGAFAGTAVFFGTAFDLRGVLIAVVVGGLLGLLSEKLGASIQRAVDGHEATAPVDPAVPA